MMEEVIRVLGVDDEEGMRLGVQRVLQGFVLNLPDLDTTLRFEVTSAADGESAIACLGSATFDIMLLDHKMPGLSGLDVMAWLQERREQQSAEQGEGAKDFEPLTIMVTAYASLDTAVEAMKRGAFDFLAKPFTPAEIRSVVRKAATHLMVQRQARKLAEEKRRLRFEFISVLAHELKAPLNSIEGYLEIVRSKSAGDDQATYDRMIERCITRLQSMRKLIMDLLDSTRVESGTKPREMTQINLLEVAKTALETVQPEATARGITLRLPTETPVMIRADAAEIDIIFNNLISNAVKYNRDGGEVEVALYERDDKIEIAVRDTGIGLSPDEAAKLFKDFVRIKNRMTKGILGTGLGLATVKKVAQLYHGDVQVESQPEVGSVFRVTLAKEEVKP